MFAPAFTSGLVGDAVLASIASLTCLLRVPVHAGPRRSAIFANLSGVPVPSDAAMSLVGSASGVAAAKKMRS